MKEQNHTHSTKNRGKRRLHPRKSFFMSVDFAVDGRLHQGYIKNISPTGLFIELGGVKRPAGGSAVTLTFSHPDSQNHVKTKGEIVRVEDSGIGVRLHDGIALFA